MDPDEFDDDILDEDMILAASQAPSRSQLAQSVPRRQASGPGRPGPIVSKSASKRASRSSIQIDDFPSDAFSSSPVEAGVATRNLWGEASGGSTLGSRAGQNTAYRQTTLFGQPIQDDEPGAPNRLNTNRAFRVDLSPEAPSHHELDAEALKTWVYPTNLGPIRDYQYSIVKNGLFNNTLVALPTGLGKTFIAATIMLNFFRWTKSAKLIFVAPTKPLVSQQVDACFNIAGIPRSQTTLLTGEVPPKLRAEEWESKRVFFMTPQTLENDLSHGYGDPKSIGLLVVDEAHRATGNYSYVKVVSFIRRFSKSFRVLALTATPGSKVEGVQEVIDNMGISHVEIRTEESLDIRQYVHQREEDIVLLDPSDQMVVIKDLFSRALKPLVDKLSQHNIYYGRDPMSLTTFGLLKSRKDWFARSGQHGNPAVKFTLNAVFMVLTSLAHSIKLLNFHGIRPFYENLKQFREEAESKGSKGSKWRKQITDSASFQDMMDKIAVWAATDDFISHPKLTYLCDTVLNHFMDAGENNALSTRIIVFSEYRDSAEEIVRVLNLHRPMVRAAVFVGQADSRRSEGMKQAEQIERIRKFKQGDYNVLVATSIGEEGLDIGQVDLIICYDASASPIRMLQRMGRTGRKRAGKVVLLLMRGKEEENYAKSRDGYEKMQVMICEGSRFTFRHDMSTRIVPREIRPEVDKRAVEIPIENTQNQSLPKPKKGQRGQKKKKPAKKFHMPDGVETGFTSVTAMLGGGSTSKAREPRRPAEEKEVVDVPSLEQVLLGPEEADEFQRSYCQLPFVEGTVEEIEPPDLTSRPADQKRLQKTVHVGHGEYTKRCVKLLRGFGRPARHPREPVEASRAQAYEQLPLPDDVSDSEDLADTLLLPKKGRKKTSTPPLHGSWVQPPDETRAGGGHPRDRSRKTRTPQLKQKAFAGLLLNSDIEDAEEEEAEEDGDREQLDENSLRPSCYISERPAPTAAAASVPRGRRPRGPRKRAAAAAYDESDDPGDDCRRTSDLALTSDSDSGADLRDFVVGDDEDNDGLSSSSPRQRRRRRRRRPSTSPPTSASICTLADPKAGKKETGRTKTRKKPGDDKAAIFPFSPSPSRRDTNGDGDGGDDDDDDDLPTMSQLVGRKKRGAPDQTEIFDEDESREEDDEDVLGTRNRGAGKRTRKRRRVVSDDDMSDDG